MRPVEIRQGTDLNIVIEMNADLSSASEIQFAIDTKPRILKTLSAGTISGVTSTQFTVAVSSTDTVNIAPREYKCQASATIGGKTYAIDFTPDKVRILDSAFLDDIYGQGYETSNSYGSY